MQYPQTTIQGAIQGMDSAPERTLPKAVQVADTVLLFERVTSTNDVAQQLLNKHTLSDSPNVLNDMSSVTRTKPWIGVVAARTQTQGRGRNGHQWLSDQGVCSTVSYVMRVPHELIDHAQRAGWLQMMSGLATRQALLQAVADQGYSWLAQPMLKWPNDVYVQGHKLGGILAQIVFDEPHNPWLIIGVGLNIAIEQAQLPTALSTSLHEHITAPSHSTVQTWIALQDAIIAATVQQLQSRLEALIAHPDNAIAHMHTALQQVSWQTGKQVHITYANGQTATGMAIGIDTDASLIVEHEGQRISVHTVDVGVLQ